MSKVKSQGEKIIKRAKYACGENSANLKIRLEKQWDTETKKFIDNWFAVETQLELLALITEIKKIADVEIKSFFELIFSAIIITKSGGVSLALDLAHTRPHRAKIVMTKSGKMILANNLTDPSPSRLAILTKTLRSPLEEFERRFCQNLKSIPKTEFDRIRPLTMFGDSQRLPLGDSSVDLIVTSPPYASNAIDYMRAHKFSLVWMGYSVSSLSRKRKEYIGGEVVQDISFENLPDYTARLIAEVTKLDKKKGSVLYRYYSEMKRSLKEMFRVIRPGKAAIVVVGSSTMRGRDTEIHNCLSEIGQAIGFEVPNIGVRNLDRNKRMLPAGAKVDLNSQIQQRMHEEYVIGFYKPVW